LAVHWKCGTPASTAATVFATAQEVSFWQWMPRRATASSGAGDERREHAAVGVAQDGGLGAGFEGGRDDAGGVLGVEAVAVEEVLAVEEDAAALADEVRDAVADHRQVLFRRGTQGTLDMAQVGLGHERHGGGLGVEQRADLRVVLRADAGLAGRTERDEDGVLEVELGARSAEELGVLRHGSGPAALDEPDAEFVEQPRDGELVDDGVADRLTLGPVAQRGVVHLHWLLLLAGRQARRDQQKNPSRMREVCAASGGMLGALGANNEPSHVR
jgi:hypothetical protein